ncbi:hypothetical protein Tco_0376342, partial [Tanacetum coccineum]
DEDVEITGLAFSEHSELLVSYAEEFIYCFSKDMGWGNDVSTILADHLTVDSDVEMEMTPNQAHNSLWGIGTV